MNRQDFINIVLGGITGAIFYPDLPLWQFLLIVFIGGCLIVNNSIPSKNG